MVQIVVRALDRVERRVPAEHQVSEARLQDVGRPGQCLVELASDHVGVHRAEAYRQRALEHPGRGKLDQIADIGEGRAVGADGPGPGGHHRHPEHALLVGGAGIDRTVGRHEQRRRLAARPAPAAPALDAGCSQGRGYRRLGCRPEDTVSRPGVDTHGAQLELQGLDVHRRVRSPSVGDFNHIACGACNRGGQQPAVDGADRANESASMLPWRNWRVDAKTGHLNCSESIDQIPARHPHASVRDQPAAVARNMNLHAADR